MQYKKTLTFYVIVFSSYVACLEDKGTHKKVTIFDPFCNEDFVYRPYIKYYRGREMAKRTGQTILRVYPGVYVDFDDADFQNAYMCINGFAWLYFTIQDQNSTRVYDSTELHSFVHTCMLIKGISIVTPSPEDEDVTPVKTRTLKGIYLMGDRKNYRLPNIHTFTAPYKDATPDPPLVFNATSLVIIGNKTECMLIRGNPLRPGNLTSVRIGTKITTPAAAPVAGSPPPPQLDFCSLQYKNIDTQMELTDSGKKFMPEFFAHKDFSSGLRHDQVIKKKKCVAIPKAYDESAAEYVKKKTAQDIAGRVAALKTEFGDLEKSPVFENSVILTSPNKPVFTADPCATPADCTPDKIATEAQPFRTAWDAETNKTSAAAEAAKKSLIEVLLKPCLSNVFRAHSEMKGFVDGTASVDTLWTAVLTEINTATTGLVAVLDKQKTDIDAYQTALKNWEDANKPPTPDATFTEYDEKLKALQTTNESLETASTKLAEVVAVAEAAESSMESLIKPLTNLLTQFRKQFEALDKGGAANDPGCVYLSLAELLKGTTFKADINVDMTKLAKVNRDTHITKFDGDVKDLTCGSFPTVEETCTIPKPTKERAAALLRARINVFKHFNSTPPTAADFSSDQIWRESVLELMARAYNDACGRVVSPEFAVGIMRIIKGYLINFVPDTIKGTVPGRSGGWPRVKSILKDCIGTRVHPHFNFTYIQSALHSDRYMIELADEDDENKKFSGEIYLNREQVQLEFNLNWAIDRFWTIFATVLGFCFVPMEYRMQGISSNFHQVFEDDFITPLKEEWKLARDNIVLEHLMGEYYDTRQDEWITMCMEGIFILPGPFKLTASEEGGVRESRILYRPVRKLRVNRESEPNFIYDDGPLQYSIGMYVLN